MSRIYCKCGECISNSTNPNIEFKIFSNEEWNNLIDRTENGEKPLDFDGFTVYFWKCTKCSRLYFFENNKDDIKEIYKLDNDQ